MGAAYFYHLTRRPIDVTLPLLIGKARGAGWRVLVRGRDDNRMQWFDEKLWLQGEESFLPHGLSGGPHDADQPVLLSSGMENGNSASCLMSIDGAEILVEEVHAADRVCIFFDGDNQDAVAHARTQWKALTDSGCAAQYWSEESGSWQKKAEKSAQ